MLAEGGHTRVGAGHLEGEAEAEVGVITGGEVHAVEAALLRGARLLALVIYRLPSSTRPGVGGEETGD